MSDLPTLAELRADETLLRRTITAVLESGPWGHHSDYPLNYADASESAYCTKCTCGFWPDDVESCSVPDEFSGSLADAAEVLKHKTTMNQVLPKLRIVMRPQPSPIEALWYAFPLEVVLACLLALGKARLDGE